MRKVVIGIFVILVLLILTAVIVPFLIPSSVYKTTIQDQLSSRIGRAVNIDGDVKISPLPSLRVKMDNVSIENPNGFSAENFVQMESLSTRIKLIPLLSKRVEVVSFDLNQPIISLEKRADGKMNWLLGEGTESPGPDKGPFQRDGRYADIEASIGTFRVQNGEITYADLTKNRAHNLKRVNIALTMKSLANPLSIQGDVIFDGIPADIELELETPRSFLLGQKTPLDLELSTGLGKVSAQGFFTESSDLHFALDMSGMLEELTPLARFLPENFTWLDITKSISFEGHYEYEGQAVKASKALIALNGPKLQSKFTGDASIGEKLSASGNLELEIGDLQNVMKAFKIEMPGGDAISSLQMKTALKTDGETIIAEDVDATLKGRGLDVDFKGNGQFGASRKINGRFESSIESLPKLARKFDVENAQLGLLGQTNVSGSLDYDGSTTELVFDQADTISAFLSGQYQGAVKITDGSITLDGEFDGLVSDPKGTADLLGNNSPYLSALGRMDVKGKISGSPDKIQIQNLDLKLAEGHLNGQYNGGLTYEESGISLLGRFDGNVPNLELLSQVTGMELPYAQSIGRINTTGEFQSESGKVAMKSLVIDLSDGELNGRFDGGAIFDDGFQLDGDLKADIPSARTLTRSTTGVELPPSTNAGDIYERIELNGRVTGNPAELKFSSAGLSMDAMSGAGDFILDLTRAKPMLNGTLDMGQMDFRPYTAAYMARNQGQGIQPWSEIPFNLSALKLMDGNYLIKTPEVIFGPLTFGQTDLNTTVTNGVMTARLPEINLYGGLGVMTATLDASGQIPKVKLAVTLEDIRSNRFLGSLANFTKLEGQGHTLLELTGEGRSQAEIMRSLNGYGDFKVVGGVIKGIDLSQLLNGIDETLTQRVLPSGIGDKYATKFDDMVGKFKIKDGVISIDSLNLKALGVLASGSGRFDIGHQKVDFGLRPRLTGTDAGDIGRFGVPIRFKGPWGQISSGPDYDFLKKIAVEKAKIKAQEEIQQRVGSGVGNVLGDLLGIPESENPPTAPEPEPFEDPGSPVPEVPVETPPPPTDAENSEVTETTTPVDPETVPEDQAKPEGSEPTPEDTPTEEDKSLEETILEKGLDQLFGKDKKDLP